MKIKSFYLLCLLLVNTTLIYAQEPRDYKVGLTTGYSYASSHFLQLGIIYGKNYGNVHAPALVFGLGSDVGLLKNKLAIGAKAYIEYNPFIITSTRLGLIHYNSQSQNDFRILPEAGISLFGLANLMYGYSIPVLGTDIVDIGKHKLTFSLNLYKKE